MIKWMAPWALGINLLLSSLPVLAVEKIALCKLVEHPALNQMEEGAHSVLKDSQYVWTVENAQGNPTLASQIAQKLAGDNYKLIIALATPMAQAMVSADSKTPILFGAVSDPVASKLVADASNPGKNVSGVTDTVPLDKVLDALNLLVPEATKIGVIYNPGESNSVTQVQGLQELASQRGLKLFKATASKSSDVLSATKSLLGEVDAILLPTDNTVISALEAITVPALKQGVPVIGMDVDTVRRGALAAVGVDWTELGRQLGLMAVNVLNGQEPGQLAVESPKQLYFHLNLKTAAKLGLDLDPSLVESADKVYKN